MNYCFTYIITLLKTGLGERMQRKLGKPVSKRKNIDDNDVKKNKPVEAYNQRKLESGNM